MTPWEIAYHFPGKYKEYVTREFPDEKMPSAGQAAQEGRSPPTVTKSLVCTSAGPMPAGLAKADQARWSHPDIKPTSRGATYDQFDCPYCGTAYVYKKIQWKPIAAR